MTAPGLAHRSRRSKRPGSHRMPSGAVRDTGLKRPPEPVALEATTPAADRFGLGTTAS
jgi:hypothetical protein